MLLRTKPLAAMLLAFGALVLAGCADMPGWDGRYATHDRGGRNRGEAQTGLPVTPYVPK